MIPRLFESVRGAFTITMKQINKVTFDSEKKRIENESELDFSASPLVQTTEMGDIMVAIYPKEDNKNIKMLGNINVFEEMGVLGISGLAELGMMTKRCQVVAMEKLRLSVSRNARGRDDAVNINRSRLDNQQAPGKSLAEGVSNWFKGGQK